MAKVLIDSRNIPKTVDIEKLIEGIQTLKADASIIEKGSIINDELLDGHDIFLILNPDIAREELKLVSKKGLVPLVHSDFVSYGFSQFKPVEEQGNSFLFENWNDWEIFAALVRCLENYQFPYDWDNIVSFVKEVNINVEID